MKALALFPDGFRAGQTLKRQTDQSRLRRGFFSKSIAVEKPVEVAFSSYPFQKFISRAHITLSRPISYQ